MFKAVKSGPLRNGAERGKGRVVHLTSSLFGGPAVCGQSPAISWSERPDREVTCPRCLKWQGKKLNGELASERKNRASV